MDECINFSDTEYKLLAKAIWHTQRRYIAGDKMFKEYGAILDKLSEIGFNYPKYSGRD